MVLRSTFCSLLLLASYFTLNLEAHYVIAQADSSSETPPPTNEQLNPSEIEDNLKSVVVGYDARFMQGCKLADENCKTDVLESNNTTTKGTSQSSAEIGKLGFSFEADDGCNKSLKEECRDSEKEPVKEDKEQLDVDDDEVPEELVVDEYKRPGSGGKKLICYYGSWATYRPGDGRYTVDMLDPHLCTHLIYSFAGLNPDGEIISLDSWNDYAEPRGLGSLKKISDLRNKNVQLKVLIGIGGWNEGSANYSRMASSADKRAKFVASVLKFLEKHKLDGLDLDWEYPSQRGGQADDKRNFVRLLRDLRRAFGPRKYLLTAAVGAGQSIIDSAYDIPRMAKYLNVIGLMTYDYHAHWDQRTGMNAPLFAGRNEVSSSAGGGNGSSNVNWSVSYWIQQGAKPHQLVLGLGLYGHSFTLNDATIHGMNAPASKPGRPGQFTNSSGSLSYYEICSLVKNDKWRVVRPEEDATPYAYNGNQWVSYDDKISIERKVRYASGKDLGGVMVWSIEQDDFRGKCHEQKYPLIKTIRRTLRLSLAAGNTRKFREANQALARASGDTPPEPVVPLCGLRNQWWFRGPVCSKYYDCTSGVPVLRDCPKGLAWNQAEKHCDELEETKISCWRWERNGTERGTVQDMVAAEEEEEVAVATTLTTRKPHGGIFGFMEGFGIW